MTGLELPPLGAPFSFSQPFDGSSIIIPAVLVAEQDYFYWPCIAGEKFAPTFTTQASNGWTNGYTSVGLYPAVGFSSGGPSGGTGNTRVTWPTLPSWKYSRSALNGYTLSFRVNLGSSVDGNGARFYVNANDYFLIQEGAVIQGSFGQNDAVTFFAHTWYSFTMTFAADASGALTVNGTTALTWTAGTSTVLTNPLLPSLQSSVGTNFQSCQAYLAQLQVTYA